MGDGDVMSLGCVMLSLCPIVESVGGCEWFSGTVGLSAVVVDDVEGSEVVGTEEASSGLEKQVSVALSTLQSTMRCTENSTHRKEAARNEIRSLMMTASVQRFMVLPSIVRQLAPSPSWNTISEGVITLEYHASC